MNLQRREYQQEAIAQALRYLGDRKMRGRNGIVVAPTGSGKSVLIAAISLALADAKEPAVVLQPSKEILQQNLQKLCDYGYRPAVFSASMGRREIGRITLATIGTVMKNIDAFSHVRHMLVDECHAVNAGGGMYAEFAAWLGENGALDETSRSTRPDVRVLGFTATPYRLASTMMGSELRFLTRTRPRLFRDIVHHTQIGALFEQAYLCPQHYEQLDLLPREMLRANSTGADYTDRSVQLALEEVGFVGKLVEVVHQKLDEGRRNVLTFTRFTDEARRLVAKVPGSAVVTADTAPGERDDILRKFKRGEIRHVANVGIVAVGFDYPELECVVLGRPSMSLALYYQQVGRDLRPVYADGYDLTTVEGRRAAIANGPKPRGYVVDMVGLTGRFGRVEDLELRNGGGDKWAIYSGDRQLTNRNFADIDAPTDPAAAADAIKAAKRRKFWATRGRRRRQ